MKESEEEEIGLHLEWNYKDIPLDIHWSACRWIYTGIKCDVPSQISLQWSTYSHMFSLSSILGSPCVLVGSTLFWGEIVDGQWATWGGGGKNPQEVEWKQTNQGAVLRAHTEVPAYLVHPLFYWHANHLISVDPCLPLPSDGCLSG